METYLERFENMVQMLENDSQVIVKAFHRFPPATDSQIKQLGQKLGVDLHQSIKDFYKQTNGLQLLWSFRSNEHSTTPSGGTLDFYRQYEDYQPEDGAVMIFPLETAFFNESVAERYSQATPHGTPMKFLGKGYSWAEFGSRIRPFDGFNKYYDMAFFLDGSGNPPVILGDDHQACYTDSRVTDFESYLEFLIANKGLVGRRKDFYGQYNGHQSPPLRTPKSYWTPQRKLDLHAFLLKDIFPLSDQPGSSTAAINSRLMNQMALSAPPVKPAELKRIMEAHHQFLSSGGAGGQWQTVHVSGLVLGIYTGSRHKEGEQAAFDRRHLPPKLDMAGIPLPFANFCACHAPKVDFSDADLSHCLFTDAMLQGCLFAETNLSGTDFSRASLQGANFMNANLYGADFENCNLTGANFRGADLRESRFPGAILKDVVYG
jgi:hypothetical protein